MIYEKSHLSNFNSKPESTHQDIFAKQSQGGSP